MAAPLRAAVLTVSDSVAEGHRADESGPAVRKILEASGWQVSVAEVLPDDFPLLRERLLALVSGGQIDLILTTGGTGLGARDITPEATSAVMERSLPGVAESMRRVGAAKTPFAVLSRALAGVSRKTVIVNLPGSPKGARDSLNAILEVLPHAVKVIHGVESHSDTGEPTDTAETA